MEQQLPVNITKLLQDLQNPEAFQRKQAAEDLGKSALRDERIINALKAVADSDTDKYVRNTATEALAALGYQAPVEKEDVPQELSQAARSTAPAKGRRWIGWGIAGVISGIVISLISWNRFSSIYSERYYTGGLEPALLVCAQIWLVGLFGGFGGGVIGGFSWKIIETRIRSRLSLPLEYILALSAGAIPAVIFAVSIYSSW